MKGLAFFTLLLGLCLVGCGGAQGSANATGASFTVEITGDKTATIASPNAVASLNKDETTNTKLLYFGDPANSRAVSLIFWGMEPTAGTYDIVDFDMSGEEFVGVTGLYVDNADDTLIRAGERQAQPSAEWRYVQRRLRSYSSRGRNW